MPSKKLSVRSSFLQHNRHALAGIRSRVKVVGVVSVVLVAAWLASFALSSRDSPPPQKQTNKQTNKNFIN